VSGSICSLCSERHASLDPGPAPTQAEAQRRKGGRPRTIITDADKEAKKDQKEQRRRERRARQKTARNVSVPAPAQAPSTQPLSKQAPAYKASLVDLPELEIVTASEDEDADVADLGPLDR
jgi:hypothetical protein